MERIESLKPNYKTKDGLFELLIDESSLTEDPAEWSIDIGLYSELTSSKKAVAYNTFTKAYSEKGVFCHNGRFYVVGKKAHYAKGQRRYYIDDMERLECEAADDASAHSYGYACERRESAKAYSEDDDLESMLRKLLASHDWRPEDYETGLYESGAYDGCAECLRALRDYCARLGVPLSVFMGALTDGIWSREHLTYPDEGSRQRAPFEVTPVYEDGEWLFYFDPRAYGSGDEYGPAHIFYDSVTVSRYGEDWSLTKDW